MMILDTLKWVVTLKSVNRWSEYVLFTGEAEAFAIEAKAKAEAEQMAKKADAWKEYKEAAIIDMML